MSNTRPANVVATLLKLTGLAPTVQPVKTDPGCTCESCMQAWGRQRKAKRSQTRESRLRLGLY
jgi:hypothetical protein